MVRISYSVSLDDQLAAFWYTRSDLGSEKVTGHQSLEA